MTFLDLVLSKLKKKNNKDCKQMSELPRRAWVEIPGSVKYNYHLFILNKFQYVTVKCTQTLFPEP